MRTRVRHDAERLAIEANEPIRDVMCADANYFELQAVEVAQRLANELLEKQGE